MPTIQEHFQGRQRATVGVVVIVGVAAVFLRRLYWPAVISPYALGIVSGLVLIPLIAAYTVKAYRCPRCGIPYHKMIEKPRGFWARINMARDKRLYWDRWDACPHCGISFNDPWP